MAPAFSGAIIFCLPCGTLTVLKSIQLHQIILINISAINYSSGRPFKKVSLFTLKKFCIFKIYLTK
jgi:hypothetical protein